MDERVMDEREEKLERIEKQQKRKNAKKLSIREKSLILYLIGEGRIVSQEEIWKFLYREEADEINKKYVRIRINWINNKIKGSKMRIKGHIKKGYEIIIKDKER